jgi:hypothetical protein
MPFRFLDLPPELRNIVYREVLNPSSFRRELDENYTKYAFDLSILLVCQQIKSEAWAIFRQNFVFVRVETPWDEAQGHVERDGHVPLVATGELAEAFVHHHISVVIQPPHYGALDRDSRKFVLLADDLVAFTQMWAYRHLSTGDQGGELNQHLGLLLKLRNPSAVDPDAIDNELPVALQKRLLEPFGKVKKLRQVEVLGPHSAAVEQSMRDLMEVPDDSPEVCLERGNKLKDMGNVALKVGNPAEALKLYIEAFRAIHIVCVGQYRAIWGDAWFNRLLTHEPFKNQYGHFIRVKLRTRLVANIIKAYLDMENYEEAWFWGDRTINLVRITSGMRDDQHFVTFPAALELGKIFYRTGLALKHMNRPTEARSCFKSALGYLPGEEATIATALASVSPALYLG